MSAKTKGVVMGVLGAGLAIVVACGGGGGTTPACNNGDTRACVGAGGCAGGQTCNAGAWSSCDCGGNEAGVDGATPDGATEASTDAGPDITPYLKNCPQIAGTAAMVEIPAQGGGSFCIDVREVTGAEFTKQLGIYPQLNWSTGCGNSPEQPIYCQTSDRQKGDLRTNCVAWCDAEASCTLVGKRLCTAQEYASACLAGGMDYPWGLNKADMDSRCAGVARPASQSSCSPDQPPQHFVKDLVAVGGPEYLAAVGQATTGFKSAATLCESTVTNANDIKRQTPGGMSFRCCAATK